MWLLKNRKNCLCTSVLAEIVSVESKVTLYLSISTSPAINRNIFLTWLKTKDEPSGSWCKALFQVKLLICSRTFAMTVYYFQISEDLLISITKFLLGFFCWFSFF